MLVLADNNPVRHITRPWVNYALIALCVIIFFAQPAFQFYGFTPADLQRVAFAPEVGQPGGGMVALQMVSYIFLHADILHLAGNMLALWVFGNNIEDSMGHARYALFFLLCGIAGALAEGLFSAVPDVPVVGASGAIAGVMGAYLLLHPRARVLVLVAFRFPLLVPASAFVGLAVFVDLTSAIFPDPDSDLLIAWWAHLGGFSAGALLILVMRHRDVALFQPAAIYPENGFGWLGRYLIDLGPKRGDDTAQACRWRQLWAGVKTVVFFLIIVVGVELIFA
ncbi:MAG: rhomboid family intramembrane serine protease [Pararhodobacter sp.]|nr:rhomboid family intramembrane serine protease [Pararhodobacter sp.]